MIRASPCARLVMTVLSIVRIMVLVTSMLALTSVVRTARASSGDVSRVVPSDKIPDKVFLDSKADVDKRIATIELKLALCRLTLHEEQLRLTEHDFKRASLKVS